MPKNDAASLWLQENDPLYGKRKRPRNDWDAPSAKDIRGRRMKSAGSKSLSRRWRCEYERQSVKDFVEAHRDLDQKDCKCVPGAQTNVPATVTHCGKRMSAARFMLLLTQGTPKSEGMHARHKCGNGHLSCVNPAHLEWGTPGDNIGDANIHRAMEGATVEDKCRAVDARTSK